LSASETYTIHVVESSFPLVQTDLSRTNGSVLLSWQATIGSVYQVQHADNLKQPAWTAGPNLTATTKTLNFIDTPSANTNRFYRVLLLP
jgi:hypothetical protein